MLIGFIGLGNMGRPMALNLIKKGHELVVSDIVPAAVGELVSAGARAGETPAAVAGQVEVLITMLPNAAIVAGVMTGEKGVLAGARPGLVVIDMSSVGPGDSRKMAAAAAKKQVAYLDAPVSGGVAGAKAGKLTIMVGGPEEVFWQVKPVLECLGEKIYHVGDVGAGDAVKVVNNLLLGINMAAVAEALVLGAKAGLKPEVMLEIIGNSSGQSYAFKAKVPNFVLPGRFEPGFAIDLQAKDLDLALQTARENDVPLMLGGLARQVYALARARGLGGQDIAAVIKVWEEATGAEVRYDPQG
ncbi:NAD(P)-dependent oxidoreductase [Moorella sp. Hama-1]|uniref:NAD(P)-dependent oxidoreductase n=1 Tax=Moorella sp. Hama-1 TaxID=2138101 RepID=UPI000D6597E4|nr:NAD(P)-dependent oxidoreductase [Moorella sp. Hama-1]BCV23079.1 2-hydroxy-3-oxopropionate reductase [Moorella sp. Hama-1]